MRKKKRGQITIFIIAGIFILLILAIVTYMAFFRTKGLLDPSVKDALDRGTIPPLQIYVQTCTEKVSPEIITLLARQGGTLEPIDDIYFKGNQLNYLCYSEGGDISYSCVNSLLLRQNMEDELGRQISKKVKQCVDLENFRNQGYKIEEEEISTKVIIGRESVFAEVNYPITLKRGEEITKTSKFVSEIKSPLGKAYEIAIDIINDEIGDGFDQDKWMVDSNVEFLIEKHRPYPDTVYVISTPDNIETEIIIVDDESLDGSNNLGGETEEGFSFIFAVQDHQTVAQKRPSKDPAYGCCVNPYDNLCFRNVPTVLCELNGGTTDYSTQCVCDPTYRYSGGGITSPKGCGSSYEPATKSFSGEEREHGESWCVYDSIVGKGFDLVGTRHYKHTCIDGKQVIEACRDYREELCTEETTDGKSKAICRKNRWHDCSHCTTEQCCENINQRDCYWNGNLETDNKCVPYVPPGLRFWEYQGSEVCFAANSQKECDGLSCANVWVDDSAVYCYNQGDCGNYRNVAGQLTTDGFFETDIFDDVRGRYVYMSEDHSKNPSPNGRRWKIELPLDTLNQPETMTTAFETPLGNIPTLVSTAFQFIDEIANFDVTDLLNPFTPAPGTHIVDFTICSLWMPPTRVIFDDQCGLCAEDPTKPCTEYKCRSLGAMCMFEMEDGYPSCYMPEKDSTPPKIEFVEESLSDGYTANEKLVVIHEGVEITPAIKPHKPFTFGIRTSEPTICKLNYAPEIEYYSLPSLWFGDSVFKDQHNITFRMPPRLSVPEKILDFLNFTDSGEFYKFVDNTVELYNYYLDKLSDEIALYEQVSGDDVSERLNEYGGIAIEVIGKLTPYLKMIIKAIIDQFNSGGYYLFVDCIDRSGNSNEEEFFIGFTIADKYDDDEAPSVVFIDPKNNGAVLETQDSVTVNMYVNEPSECRYSFPDMDFNSMNGNFECATSQYDISPIGGGTYKCTTELEVTDPTNKIFIRCKDKPASSSSMDVTLVGSDIFGIEGMPDPIGGISPYRYTNISSPNIIDVSSKMTDSLKFMVNSSYVDLNIYVEEKSNCRHSTEEKPFDLMEKSFDACVFSEHIEMGLYKCHARIDLPSMQPIPFGKGLIRIEKTNITDIGPNNPALIEITDKNLTIRSVGHYSHIKVNESNINLIVPFNEDGIYCAYNPDPVPGTPNYDMACSYDNMESECVQSLSLQEGNNSFTVECYKGVAGQGNEIPVHIACSDQFAPEGNINTQSYEYTLHKAPELRITDLKPSGTVAHGTGKLQVKVSGDIFEDKITCGYRENLYGALITMTPTTEGFEGDVSNLETGAYQFFLTCRNEHGSEVTDSVTFEVI